LGFLDLRQTSAIIATPSQTFAPRPPESALASCLETALARLPLNLPASLAFLSSYGVDPLLLLSAAGEARAQAVVPETALLASGAVQEPFFYQCLADYLGAAFVEGNVTLAAGVRYPFAIHSGIAPLDGQDGRRWLSGRLDAWLTQRRRWSKGWMQTFITITRDPRRVALELGAANAIALVLTLTGLVIAPAIFRRALRA
jgi:cellulose synthase/poly-beta-1,6-N-acetylglucosamine synthase-like glycosyltransferase